MHSVRPFRLHPCEVLESRLEDLHDESVMPSMNVAAHSTAQPFTQRQTAGHGIPCTHRTRLPGALERHASNMHRQTRYTNRLTVPHLGACARGRACAEATPLVVDLRSGDRVCGFSCGSRSIGCAHSPNVFVVQ